MSATERLVRYLAHREELLVLDNCEHVVGGAAALVATLLPACPGLRILATSREPLRVPGEMEWPVPPLDLPNAAASREPESLAGFDAVRLLIERARDVRPGFGLTRAIAPAVAGICQRLDGLPLALELAAARLRVLSPEQVAARLSDQLGLLAEGVAAAQAGSRRCGRPSTGAMTYSPRGTGAVRAAVGLRGRVHSRGCRGGGRRGRRSARSAGAPGEQVARRARSRSAGAALPPAGADPAVCGRAAAAGGRTGRPAAPASRLGRPIRRGCRTRVPGRPANMEEAAVRRARQHTPSARGLVCPRRSGHGAAHRGGPRLPVVHYGPARGARVGGPGSRSVRRGTGPIAGRRSAGRRNFGPERARLRPGDIIPAGRAGAFPAVRRPRARGLDIAVAWTGGDGGRYRCAYCHLMVRGGVVPLP